MGIIGTSSGAHQVDVPGVGLGIVGEMSQQACTVPIDCGNAAVHNRTEIPRLDL